jgi:hypothetical protein
MIVSVTQDHITHGGKGHPKHCPLALAISALLGDRQIVSVLDTTFRVFAADYSLLCVRTLPESAVFFRREFDRGHPVEPFRFEVEI